MHKPSVVMLTMDLNVNLLLLNVLLAYDCTLSGRPGDYPGDVFRKKKKIAYATTVEGFVWFVSSQRAQQCCVTAVNTTSPCLESKETRVF